jgi:hypothetical protein
MNELELSIYSILQNFKNQDDQIRHALAWCEKELKNPTPTEGFTIEEKVEKLNNTYTELKSKYSSFKSFRQKEVSKVKKEIRETYPNLWISVEARFVATQIING